MRRQRQQDYWQSNRDLLRFHRRQLPWWNTQQNAHRSWSRPPMKRFANDIEQHLRDSETTVRSRPKEQPRRPGRPLHSPSAPLTHIPGGDDDSLSAGWFFHSSARSKRWAIHNTSWLSWSPCAPDSSRLALSRLPRPARDYPRGRLSLPLPPLHTPAPPMRISQFFRNSLQDLYGY